MEGTSRHPNLKKTHSPSCCVPSPSPSPSPWSRRLPPSSPLPISPSLPPPDLPPDRPPSSHVVSFPLYPAPYPSLPVCVPSRYLSLPPHCCGIPRETGHYVVSLATPDLRPPTSSFCKSQV